MGRFRPLKADIDLGALRYNYRNAVVRAGGAHCLAVVKANAYGHGATECAQALSDLAPAFGVASIEEADALRDSGVVQPIVLLEGFFSIEEIPLMAARHYWPVVHEAWQVNALLAASLSHSINVWLKLDSGMHRLGFSPDALVRHWSELAACPHVTGMHLISHFATADGADERSRQQYAQQRACISGVVTQLKAQGYGVPLSLANSPATLCGNAPGAWHRPGIMLYGGAPSSAPEYQIPLAPVMTLRSQLIAIRDVPQGEALGYGGSFVTERPLRVGIVACGYGDGYDRHARTGTPVLVNGQRTRIIGRVSMDMLSVDITDIEGAMLGSEVVLWGQSITGAVLAIDDVARGCDTIAYTLMTGVSMRVPRDYVGASIHVGASTHVGASKR